MDQSRHVRSPHRSTLLGALQLGKNSECNAQSCGRHRFNSGDQNSRKFLFIEALSPFPALEMVKGDADEASVGGQRGGAPRLVAGFVEERGREVPCPRRRALPLIVRTDEGSPDFNPIENAFSKHYCVQKPKEPSAPYGMLSQRFSTSSLPTNVQTISNLRDMKQIKQEVL